MNALRLVVGILVASCVLAVAGGGAASGAAKGFVYVAPGGSDLAPCTQAQPCLSFDRAYHVASPGQVVEVAAGAYGPQQISLDPSKAGPPNVVLQPAPGATVRAGRTTILASNLTLQGMQFAWSAKPGANHVTLQNIKADGAVYITGAANISVLGGEVYALGGVVSDSQIASANGAVPTSILIDGVSFHDWVDAGPTPGTHHIECLQIGAGINVTVRNSSFQRCEIHDLFIRSWGNTNASPSPLRNFTIQNNYLAPTLAGYYSLRIAPQVGWPCTNFLIASNTALQNMLSDCTAAGIQFLGNSQPSMSAYSCAHTFGAVWSGNVFASGVHCGSNRVLGSSQPPPRGTPPPPLTTPKQREAGTTAPPPGDAKPAATTPPPGDAKPAATTPPPGDAKPAAATPPPGDAKPEASELRGRISGVSPTSLTVGGEHSSTICARDSSSPSLSGFKLNDKVAVTCAPAQPHTLITIAHAE